MKTSIFSSAFIFPLLFIFSFFFHNDILPQDKDPPRQHYQHYALPQFDIVQVSLRKYGKGVYYYDCLIQQYKDQMNPSSDVGEVSSVLKKPSYSEMDMKMMDQNLLFINKQSQIQIMEWIRKDKWDLNLGEAIKGFYTTPMF